MQGVKIDKGQLKEYALVVLAYLLVSMAFFWPLLSNITSTVPGSGGDVFQSLWELWWVPYSLFTLHASPYLSNLVFYPAGANLATQTFAPIAGIVSALFQWVSLAFSLNVIFFAGFVMAGFFAYLLAFHLTRNRAASFLAGFIFAFSPIHTIQAFGHLQYINIGFIPLFLLFFIRMFEDGKHSDAILAGVSFVLLAFMGDIEQALMTMVVAFLIIVYLLARKHTRRMLLSRKYLNPEVAGAGHARLRALGVAVNIGIGAAEARRDHAGHLRRMRDGRPHVMLKLAISADGKAGAAGRRPAPITGEAARERVHLMRAQSDAIMIGIGTAFSDDPMLTCRLPGMAKTSPLRIVLDSALRLPLGSRLAKSAVEVPVWVVAENHAPQSAEDALKAQGVEVLRVEGSRGRLNLTSVLKLIARRGITRLMVEGGPTLASALLAADLVDEANLFVSPRSSARTASMHSMQRLKPHLCGG